MPLMLLGNSEQFKSKRDMNGIAVALIADGKARAVEKREELRIRRLQEAASGGSAKETEKDKNHKNDGTRGRKRKAAAGSAAGSQ